MTVSRSILVADDEETFRESTCRLLRREGYDCDSAGDTEEAVAKLRRRPFDLLIADIRMPRNQEMRLVREAQRLAQGMPVILVTGYPSLDTAIRSIGMPVTAYLTKPVDFPDLLSHVRPSVERSQRHRTLSRVRERLRQCLEDLEQVGHESESSADGASRVAPAVSTATIRTVAACLSELLEIRGKSCSGKWSPNLCDLLDCPQRPVHRKAIQETVEVLKKTKSTFKSKDLAQLREKLEELLSTPEGFFYDTRSWAPV